MGLQLTHSGRYCRPNAFDKPEPRILYHHPILDRKLGLSADYPLLTDGEIEAIIEDFHRAAKGSARVGIRLRGHQTLPRIPGTRISERAYTRRKIWRQLRKSNTISARNRARSSFNAPGLQIGVRLSAFDTVPFRQIPSMSLREWKAGTGNS